MSVAVDLKSLGSANKIWNLVLAREILGLRKTLGMLERRCNLRFAGEQMGVDRIMRRAVI